MARQIAREGDAVILYDDTLLSHASPALFTPAALAGADTVPASAGGRGRTLFINHEGRQLVLRHYWRGGLAGRVLSDRYAWLGEARTRCFREWTMLAELHRLGLPVPQPVAAHYRRHGLSYVADLLTVRLPGVEALSFRLSREEPAAATWAAVGACIRRFHDAGAFHADLNAHNLQIDGDGRVFLLDFDRGRFRHGGAGWRKANLQRLHRSLVKISREPAVDFGSRQWGWLLGGYTGTVSHKDQDAAVAGS